MTPPDQRPAQRPIARSSGTTPAERYLGKLCDGTFLSLWSYPGLYRDQRESGGAEGKEIADLLVIFENDIIIFSDKHCRFPSSADIKKDWARWFRRAVQKSAEQAWGAERWLRQFPDRLFLDRKCTRPFPFPIPREAATQFHLIVVAHDISAHCARALGGSGSLMLHSDLKGFTAHQERPFTVGDLDPNKTFIHVLDDVSLDVVLQTLDTIADFTAYLQRKERLLRSPQLILATGEEELLATYLTRTGPDGEHAFVLPTDVTGVLLGEGAWERFTRHPQRIAQIEANRVSYVWDRLIEQFNKHALAGTHYHVEPEGAAGTERIMRFMAREPRLRRRLLGGALTDLLKRIRPSERGCRVMAPSRLGDPFYVFLLLPVPTDRSYEEYRTARAHLLQAYCQTVKLRFPEAQDIVGIATEPGSAAIRSEDAVYLDARIWSEEIEREAKATQDELKLLVNIVSGQSTTKEYPETREKTDSPSIPVPGPNPRNKPCPCGSGLKFKRCHER